VLLELPLSSLDVEILLITLSLNSSLGSVFGLILALMLLVLVKETVLGLDFGVSVNKIVFFGTFLTPTPVMFCSFF